jgi:hypothetical protein
MKESIKYMLLAASLLSASFSSIAEYKINIHSDILNKNTKLVEVVPPGPVLVPFDETDNGNIVLIGSNGINSSSIGANFTPSNSSFPLAGMFDGYDDNSQINSSSLGKIQRGWFYDSSGNHQNKWFSIDLGRIASISGFRVLTSDTNLSSAGYIPENIRIESSEDGLEYEHNQSFTLAQLNDSGVISFTDPLITRYFKFKIDSTYHGSWLRIGELEIYQTQL